MQRNCQHTNTINDYTLKTLANKSNCTLKNTHQINSSPTVCPLQSLATLIEGNFLEHRLGATPQYQYGAYLVQAHIGIHLNTDAVVFTQGGPND